MVPSLRFLKNAPNSGTLNWLSWRWWMMNYFCGMVDQRKMFSLISSWDHCQRSSPSQISDTPQAGFEPAQNQVLFRLTWMKLCISDNHHATEPSYWTLWLNNLGKSITCNMFSDPTLLWSLELDIHNLFSAQCHPSFKYSSKFNYLHLDQLLVSKIATSGTWNSPNLLSLITKWVR